MKLKCWITKISFDASKKVSRAVNCNRLIKVHVCKLIPALLAGDWWQSCTPWDWLWSRGRILDRSSVYQHIYSHSHPRRQFRVANQPNLHVGKHTKPAGENRQTPHSKAWQIGDVLVLTVPLCCPSQTHHFKNWHTPRALKLRAWKYKLLCVLWRPLLINMGFFLKIAFLK